MIIYAKDESELLHIMKEVFHKARELGLKLNRENCDFIQNEIKFFDIEITEKGINADPEKIKAIQNAKAPSVN